MSKRKYFQKSFTYDIETLLLTSDNLNKHTVLIVDDEEDNIALLKRTLRCSYNVLSATCPKDALAILEEHDNISVVITDQKMPEMNGTDLIKTIYKKYPQIVNILLTSHCDYDLLVEAINDCHLFQYILKPFEPDDLCMTIASGIRKFELSNHRQQIIQDLSELFYKTIKSIALALDTKDPYTHGHSLRVTIYSLAIANKLGLSDSILEEIETAGLLHDIGKISIPEKILRKPGKLTDEEYCIIKKHPELGERLIVHISQLELVSNWLKAHHEKYDGTGYPDGLKGEEIPISARIIAIADTYDAMTSDRSYRKALPHSYAMEEIKRCSGTQFDPKLAELFFELSDEIELIKSNPDLAYQKYSYLNKMMNSNVKKINAIGLV